MAVSFTNNMEYDLLRYIAGNLPAWHSNTSFYWAAATGNPTDAGTAGSSEVTGVVNYARVEAIRLSSLTVTGGTFSNASLIQFPLGGASSSSVTITHVNLVDTITGSGNIILPFELTNSIPYGTGIRPQIEAGQATFTLD